MSDDRRPDMNEGASTDQQNDGHDADGAADERTFEAFMEAIFDGDMQKAQRMFLPDYLDRRFGTDGENPLHKAAERGQQDMVYWLIKQGASLDATDMNGQTAAHSAVLGGHADVLQLLVDTGCNTDIVDKVGLTLMDYARYFGYKECVRVLTKSQNYGDQHLVNFEICMKMIPAVFGKDNESPMANQMKDAMKSMFTDEGMTVLREIVTDGTWDRMMPMMIDKRRNMASYEWMALMDDIDAMGMGDLTKVVPYFFPAFCGNDEMIEMVLKRRYLNSTISLKTDTNLVDDDGDNDFLQAGVTLLMYAAYCGNENAVRMLVAADVDVEASDKSGYRASHMAASSGHEEILRCLIDEGGCVIDAVDKKGNTPLDIANQYGHKRCAALLRDAMETRQKTEFTVVHLSSYSIVFRSHKIFDMDNALRHIRERIIPLNRSAVIVHSTALWRQLLSSEGTLQLISDRLGFEEYVAMGADASRQAVESSVKKLRDWDIRFMWDDNKQDRTIPQSDVAVEIGKATAAENWRDHLFVSIDLRAEGTDVTKETVTMLMAGTAAVNDMKDMFIDFVKRRLRTGLVMTTDDYSTKDTMTRMILMNKQLMTFYNSRQQKMPSTQRFNEMVVASDGRVSVIQKCFDDVKFLGTVTDDNMGDMLCQKYVIDRSITEERKAMVVPRKNCHKVSDIAKEILSFLHIQGKLQLLSTDAVIDLNTAIDDVHDVIHYAIISPYIDVTSTADGKLGSGGYGQVWRCTLPDSDKIFAIKRVTSDITAEILVAAKVGGHKRIMKCHRFYEEEPYLFILMDCMKESLSDHLKKNNPLSQQKILILSRGILEGLKYLHDHKIIHRDLKGGNVLLDDNDFVKLTDFGSSTFLDIDTIRAEHEGVNMRAGTYNYMAPEMMVVSTQQQAHSYGLKADIWSFGATMIEMVTGKPPFSGIPMTAAILKLHKTKTIDYKFPPRLDKELKGFIDCCLNADPNERPNCFVLLAHDVFVDVDDVDVDREPHQRRRYNFAEIFRQMQRSVIQSSMQIAASEKLSM